MNPSLLAQPDRLRLENDVDLRLLSALEMLQAKREADSLAQTPAEHSLCANACLLARALEHAHTHAPLFPDGQAVLAGLTPQEIGSLAERWAGLHQSENPGFNLSQSQLETLKKNSATAPQNAFAGASSNNSTPCRPNPEPSL